MSTSESDRFVGAPAHLAHKIANDDRKLRRMGRKLRASLAKPGIALDVRMQKHRLRHYVTAVERVTQVRPFDGGRFCIFHYYETNGQVSASVQRILAALARQNVNILLVSNSRLAPAQISGLSDHVAVILERENIGQDFGGYKDAVRYLTERLADEALTPERVIFLNDSVFFLSHHLDAYVTGLLGDEDLIHACDNWSVWHHLQSFAFSVSGQIFLNPSVQAFWAHYVPVSERNYAIQAGEMGLSDTLSAVATTSRILFSAADAVTRMDGVDTSPAYWVPRIGRRLSSKLGNAAFAALPPAEKLTQIVDMVSRSTLTNNATYIGLRYGQVPFIKKNLVYMSVFYYHQIEQWVLDVMTPDEAREFLHLLRMKGDPNAARRARQSKASELTTAPA